jgi:hypothetical protein
MVKYGLYYESNDERFFHNIQFFEVQNMQDLIQILDLSCLLFVNVIKVRSLP